MILIICIAPLVSGCVGEMFTSKLYHQNFVVEESNISLRTDKLAARGDANNLTITAEYIVKSPNNNNNFKEILNNSFLSIICNPSFHKRSYTKKNNLSDREKELLSDDFNQIIVTFAKNSNNDGKTNVYIEKGTLATNNQNFLKHETSVCGENGINKIEFLNNYDYANDYIFRNNPTEILITQKETIFTYEHPLLFRVIGTPFAVAIDIISIPFILLASVIM